MEMRLRNPKPRTEYRRVNGRLALFQEMPGDQSYWASYWDSGTMGTEEPSPPQFAEFLLRHCPVGRPVLEAGCGRGDVVRFLHARGHEVIGIDNERRIVEKVRTEFPHLDVRLGDVTSLDIATSSVGCYISVGVIEHFRHDPLPVVHEARRVVQESGRALFSVPYLNPLRHQLLKKLGNSSNEDGVYFHQYYFSFEQIHDVMSASGFRIIDQAPYAHDAFLIREHPVVARAWQAAWMRTRLKRVLRPSLVKLPSVLKHRYAHMLMVACEPV